MSKCEQKAGKYKTLKQEIKALKSEVENTLGLEKSTPNVKELMALCQRVLDTYKETEKLTQFFNSGDLKPFLRKTYGGWGYNPEQQAKAEENLKNSTTLPTDKYLSKLHELRETNKDDKKREANKENIGTIIQCENTAPYNIEKIKQKIKVINPELPEYKKIKDFIIEFKKQNNREPYIHEVFEEIHNQYPNYIFGDIQTFQTIQEYSESSPEHKEEIKTLLGPEKDWIWYLYPGSAFANESGRWCCPDSDWAGAVRTPTGLGRAWVSDDRVVLLKR